MMLPTAGHHTIVQDHQSKDRSPARVMCLPHQAVYVHRALLERSSAGLLASRTCAPWTSPAALGGRLPVGYVYYQCRFCAPSGGRSTSLWASFLVAEGPPSSADTATRPREGLIRTASRTRILFV